MTTKRNLNHGDRDGAKLLSSTRLRIMLALPAAAIAAAAIGACSSSSGASSGPPSGAGGNSQGAAAAGTVHTAKVGGMNVLTSNKGFTLYSFAPDTPTTSKCNGTCAANWPPVKGPVTAAGVKSTFGTIKRSDGSTQATFHGHPLYTFVGDTAPGQDKGNGLNAAGGLWHDVTATGAPAAAARPSASSSAGVGY